MKENLLLKMLELTEQQSKALREDNYELLELSTKRIEDVRKEVEQIDKQYGIEKSNNHNELIFKIKELTDINIQIGSRKLIGLQDKLRRIRENKSRASVYSQGYGDEYQESGMYFDKK